MKMNIVQSDRMASTALCGSSHVQPALFDPPDYQRDQLDLKAETGRIADKASDNKGALAIPVCEQHLRSMFPNTSVSCRPSFPLGWSATVPLKATVADRSGASNRLFLKFCDDHDGILRQVEKEYIWQKALWERGVTTIARPLRFDFSTRLFVSCQAEGISAPKSLFETPALRNQVAQFLENLHAISIKHLPGESSLFLRPVQQAIDEGLSKGQLDPVIAERVSLYALEMEQAIGVRYEASVMERAVHGDMKAGNMLFDESQKTLTFTDFGMAHRGDPASDIGFFLADVHRPISDTHSFVRHYERNREASPLLLERALLHTAYNRLERYVRYQDWCAGDAGAKKAMAGLVEQDRLVIRPLLVRTSHLV